MKIIKVIFEYLLGYFFIIFRYIFKIKEKQIMFFTFQGAYTCNAKYISEKLIRENRWKIIWVKYDNDEEFPQYVTAVKFGSFNYFKSLYTSKILVENAFNFVKRPFLKKVGQYCIQTMHGSLGIKRIDPSSLVYSKRRNRIGEKSALLTDCIISNSDFENMVYRTSFWHDTRILMLGHARTDILFCDDGTRNLIRNKVRDYYGFEKNSFLALYAPTFYSGSRTVAMDMDYKELKNALTERFGGNWYILRRMHPRDIRNSHDNNSAHVIDGNKYEDIQELMVAIDFGITDYSSWIFDYVLTHKPGAIYAPDMDDYINRVGVYYPITQTPFIISTTNEQLSEGIRSYDAAGYYKKVDLFIREKGCIDDGKSTERIIDYINGLLDNE